MTSAVVFDLDGTLIDSAPDIWHAANRVLDEAGLPPVTFQQARDFVGRGARVFAARLEKAALGDNQPARTVHFQTRFLYHYERAHDHTRIYPHVEAALDALRAQGLRLGLCTNKPFAPTRAVLAHFGWSGLFDVVIAGDSLDVAKPDPAPLRAVVDGMGLQLSQIAYIGDSETDAETARRAGARFGLYTQGYRRTAPEEMFHHFRFDDYRQLPGHLFPEPVQ
ncbi:MAG: phosphoglycolate phosphatase [Rhodobacteraceae bacterium]|nr:phosphoglycolate phosphatase [Paracoccaceae bacterium]